MLGMLTGLLVCVFYMVTNHEVLRRMFGITWPLADCRWWGIDPVAAGVFGVPAGALVLVLVSLLTARPGPEQLAVVARLRDPLSGKG